MTQVAEHYSESENIKPADFELAGCFFTIIPNLAQNHPNLIWFITYIRLVFGATTLGFWNNMVCFR